MMWNFDFSCTAGVRAFENEQAKATLTFAPIFYFFFEE